MSFYCTKCKKDITEAEYHFSYKNFGKPLCRADQPTTQARKLGKKLKEVGDWEIVYEAFDDHKHVDLSIPDAKVDIEVDGLQHHTNKKQALSDLKRTYYSYRNDGFITLHVPNILLNDDSIINETAVQINKFLKENEADIADNFIVRFIRWFIGFFKG